METTPTSIGGSGALSAASAVMQVPLQITFRAVSPSDAVTERIRARVAKLEALTNALIGCHVTVALPHRHQTHGKHFSVRVEMSVPGRTLVVTHDPPERMREDLYAAIDDAFDDAVRVLENHVRKLRSTSRPHRAVVTGVPLESR
jgi:ribosome-associated translation inhibitor RaiA